MKRLFLASSLMALVGCTHVTKMEHVYIDNSAVNNFVGNPCAFYVGDRCIYMKPTARNPDAK